MPGTVTAAEKRMALAPARRLEHQVRRALTEARREMFGTLRDTVAAYRRNDPFMLQRLRDGILEHADRLGSWMAAAEVLGRDVSRRRSSLVLSISEGAGDYLRRHTDLSEDQIRRLVQAMTGKSAAEILRLADFAKPKVLAALREIVADNLHVRAGTAKLMRAFDAANLSPAAPHRLEAIYRTHMQMSYSAGQWHADHDPDVEEMLWGYKYVTVGDDRVRDEHAEMEGVTAPKDDPIWDEWFPPNGWNCRCDCIPIYEERPVVRPEVEVHPDRGFILNPGKYLPDVEGL